MDNYKPVNNQFKEELEILAAMKTKCFLSFAGDNGAPVNIHTTILNVYSIDEASYLKTESGLQIRLDKLLTIDGKKPENWA